MKLFFNVERATLYVMQTYFQAVTTIMNAQDSVSTWEFQMDNLTFVMSIVNENAESINVRIGVNQYRQIVAQIKPDYDDFSGLPMGFKYPCARINVECGPTKMAARVLSFMPQYRELTERSHEARLHETLRIQAAQNLRQEFYLLLNPVQRQYGDWINVQSEWRSDIHERSNIAVTTSIEDTIGGDFIERVSVHFSRLPRALARKLVLLALTELNIDPIAMLRQDDDELRDAINISNL